jgi:hypothetical protein
VYLDPSKPTEQGVADLIGRLTLEEKAQQLNHPDVSIPRLKFFGVGRMEPDPARAYDAKPKAVVVLRMQHQ